ncbi:aldo/keto reductase [Levilactobacillus spicheri]|uniref:2,5-diketo-D-gluconic acid reductase n=1 Tax=Levilactobacillus spicheri TaxID=216463 RepID=A0A0F3RTL3_9LACO|nr:aldo/keto reductase [Levilactobacillus spicheri]KJW13311.1 2,5-diketo-D-gluconic acid reductase [Levilactobacillus spicheri]
MQSVTLNNGVQMPQEGFGVYQIHDAATCQQAVLSALAAGYRSIDTAQAYGNEAAVGAALQQSSVDRHDIFLTSKIWLSNYGYEAAKASIDESLKKLQTDYLDLMLLHQPYCDVYGAYRALEEAYDAGKIRAIGVSNFYPDRLVDLALNARIVPAVNQVETHVFDQQVAATQVMAKYGVQIEAWAPLAEGAHDLFTQPVLTRIGRAHQKTAAQVALRYLLQRGVVIIPKSTHADRIAENLAIWDFTLSPTELDQIRALDTGKSVFLDHRDPAMVEEFVGPRQANNH